jgi:hypothetical protein
MTEDAPWYNAEFQAARLYMEVTKQPEGRRAIGRLYPNVLDAIARHAEAKAKTDPHGEIQHLVAKLVQVIGDPLLLSSHDLQSEVRITYDRAESLALPAAVAYRQLCHRLHGVSSSLHLQSMHGDQMELLDRLADIDAGARALHKELLLKFDLAAASTDAELPRKLAQAFETFGEFWVYRRLSNIMTIEKVSEGSTSTPDFRCSLNGRDFFIEVKSPDIVDGDAHHAELMREATEVEIKLDQQVRSGQGISSATSVIAPFQKLGDKKYDGGDRRFAISTLRDRARTLFKPKQFSAGPTVALMFIDRYPVGDRRAILPDYKVGGMWSALPDDRQSGIVWQAAFGTPSTEIHNLFYPKLPLLGTPFMRDAASPFPGIGFVTMTTIHSGSPAGTTECWGLLDRQGSLPSGWLLADTAMILNAMCEVWNDDKDRRPKWQDV